MTTLAGEAVVVIPNGSSEDSVPLIDDDINHTVGRLFMVRPQQNNLVKGKKEPIEDIVSRALQAERNHWKDRLQLAMQEIDRQHRVILATHSGLQELVKSLRYVLQKNVIFEEEDESEDADQEMMMSRLIENLKFQIRQLKVKAGIADVSKHEFEDNQTKHKQNIKELQEALSKLGLEKEHTEIQLKQKDDKVVWLQKENSSLLKQLEKLQRIVFRYNQNHSGTNFHLNIVEAPATDGKDKRHSAKTLDLHENSVSPVRERTYIEGDQMHSYPTPEEENAVIKERLKKNIYAVRKRDQGQSSTSVAKCLRCQCLFRPAENNHKSCRFHHKGREIKETFDSAGKLEKVDYKWACCKKPLETPGCCYGYHV